jgi:hypothetical protein
MEDLEFNELIESLQYSFNSEGLNIPYIFAGATIEEVVLDLLQKVEENGSVLISQDDWCIQVDSESMSLSWGIMNSDCFELFTMLKLVYGDKQEEAEEGFAETYRITLKYATLLFSSCSIKH